MIDWVSMNISSRNGGKSGGNSLTEEWCLVKVLEFSINANVFENISTFQVYLFPRRCLAYNSCKNELLPQNNDRPIHILSHINAVGYNSNVIVNSESLKRYSKASERVTSLSEHRWPTSARGWCPQFKGILNANYVIFEALSSRSRRKPWYRIRENPSRHSPTRSWRCQPASRFRQFHWGRREDLQSLRSKSPLNHPGNRRKWRTPKRYSRTSFGWRGWRSEHILCRQSEALRVRSKHPKLVVTPFCRLRLDI